MFNRENIWRAGRFLAVQGSAQLLSSLAGLVLVWLLPRNEYAKYTLASTVLVMTGVLSDVGLTSAIVGLGGKRVASGKPLSDLFHSVSRFRRWLYCFSTLSGASYLLFVGLRSGWDYRAVFLLPITVGIVGFLQLEIGVRSALAKLLGRVSEWQGSEVRNGIAKLLAGLCLLPVWPFALAGLAGQAVGYLAQLSSLSLAKFGIPLRLAGSRECDEEVKRFVRPLLAPSIFFALNGQISYWVLGVVGVGQVVADLGALARLGQLFGIVFALYQAMIIPALARMRDLQTARKSSAQVVVCQLLVSALVVGAAHLAPGGFLLVLGPQYSGLAPYVGLVVLLSLVSLLGDILYSMTVGRGFTKGQSLSVPVQVAVLCFAAVVSPPKDLSSALYFELIRRTAFASLQLGLASRTFGWFGVPLGTEAGTR